MARLLSTLLVVGLLGGTAAAFAVTESLKLQRSPIFRTEVDKVISPVCACGQQAARIAFTLRSSDYLTVTIVDSSGARVATVVDSQRFRNGKVAVRWDGRDDAGRRVPDGSYKPRVHLQAARRTIVLPNPIRVDTRTPTIELLGVRPVFFSPDGDGRNDGVKIRYRVDEPAHALLYVNGKRRVYGRWQPLQGQLEWFGKVGRRVLPAGPYRLQLGAVDLAGNRADLSSSRYVTIRYIALARLVIHVRAGARFGVRVVTDARRFTWRFAGRSGVARAGLLVLRARRAGRFHLFVEERGHAARALVVVRPHP